MNFAGTLQYSKGEGDTLYHRAEKISLLTVGFLFLLFKYLDIVRSPFQWFFALYIDLLVVLLYLIVLWISREPAEKTNFTSFKVVHFTITEM